MSLSEPNLLMFIMVIYTVVVQTMSSATDLKQSDSSTTEYDGCLLMGSFLVKGVDMYHKVYANLTLDELDRFNRNARTAFDAKKLPAINVADYLKRMTTKLRFVTFHCIQSRDSMHKILCIVSFD